MPPDPRSDAELVAAANRGDSAAMEAIYLRHRDWALRLAWRFTGDHELAADVVQEVFIYLFRKFGGAMGGGSGKLVLRAKLTTLLYPAIRNTALAARRKKRPATLTEGFDAPDERAVHVPDADGDEQKAELLRLLETISDAHREVLLMRVVDGMELAEIALALGIPEGTVKSRVHNALAALRKDAEARERLL